MPRGKQPVPAGDSNLYLKKILWSQAVRSRVESGRPQFSARAGVVARSAGTPSAFLEIAATDQPDLILLDAASAELPVDLVCRTIRQDQRTESIPILCLGASGTEADTLLALGCSKVIDNRIDAQALQESIASALGISLRRYTRFPVVLPVARGRIFHEFLGYSSELSEGGMGFETISRVNAGDHLSLRLYRNTEEKPISAVGRVRSFRPNIDTGIGYAVGVEFVQLRANDRERLLELFPSDPCLTWGPDAPQEEDTSGGRAARFDV